MSIQVSLANSSIRFPNFLNICQEVQKKATEMGIKRNIRINYGIQPAVSGIDVPSNFATLQLPKDFSSNSSAENATEFILRHELAHILHNDDLTNKYSKYLPYFTASVGFAAGIFLSKAIALFSTHATVDLCSIPICFTLLPLFISNYVYTRMKGGITALRFKEKRADEEACKYISIEEKINRIKHLQKRVRVEGYNYGEGEMSKFRPWPDEHPTIKQRIQIVWNTFSKEQKIQHPELDPMNIIKPSSILVSIKNWLTLKT